MIHYDIPEPDLSPDFTLDDIRKIRDWNYERMKDATHEEQIDHYRRVGEKFQAETAERRKAKGIVFND